MVVAKLVHDDISNFVARAEVMTLSISTYLHQRRICGRRMTRALSSRAAAACSCSRAVL
jgi:hypothetical protein